MLKLNCNFIIYPNAESKIRIYIIQLKQRQNKIVAAHYFFFLFLNYSAFLGQPQYAYDFSNLSLTLCFRYA